jgi:hypothetical protein
MASDMLFSKVIKASEKELVMKVPYIFRATAITMGFAAALVLAGAAHAQEIDNTEWKDRPDASSPVPASSDQTANATLATQKQALNATPAAEQKAVQQAALVEPAGALGTIAVSIIGVGGVMLFAWTQKKRNRGFDPQASHDERSVSL